MRRKGLIIKHIAIVVVICLLMGLTAYPGKLIGGTIDFNGHRINDLTEKEFRKIRGNEVSIIFQDPMTSLNPVYTIGNQLMEALTCHDKDFPKEKTSCANCVRFL